MTSIAPDPAPRTPASLVAAAQRLSTDPAGAADLARRFLDEEPEHQEGRLLLAVALRSAGRHGEAIAVLQDLSRTHPQWQPVHYEMGLAYCAQESWALALAALRLAVKLEPGLPGAWRALGDALYELGETSQADQAYGRFLSKIDADPLIMQAIDALENRRPDIAEANARLRLKFVPSDIAAMRILANLCAHTGRIAEAELLFTAILDRAPSYIPAQFEFAHLLVRLNRREEADARIALLLEKLPGDPHLLKLKALAEAL